MTFLTDVIQVETTKGGTALELSFSRPVTADDRKAIIDAHNAACRPTPVTPVSPDATGKCGELETVMRRYRGTDWPEHYPWAYLNESECQGEAGPRWIIEELCLRSQAEELLAAERAEKEIAERNRDAARENFLTMQKSAAKLLERAEKAEANNAAKDARIKELEADRDHQSKLSNKLNRSHATLEAKLAAAEKALEPFVSFFNEAMKGFTEGYAERTPSDKPVLGWNNAYLLMQHFIEARATLGGKPS